MKRTKDSKRDDAAVTPRTSARLTDGVRLATWSAAFATVIGSASAHALAIEQMKVRSALGQPLSASVQLALAPGERVPVGCASAIVPRTASSELPWLYDVAVRLAPNSKPPRLNLFTSKPVLEPLSSLMLTLDCPGIPVVQRTFLVMLDPPLLSEPNEDGRYAETPASPQPGAASSRPAATVASSRAQLERTVTAPQTGTYGTSLSAGDSYIVRRGDTVSTIASRISGRPSGSVWVLASDLVKLNPDALLANDANQLLEGARITLPPLRADWDAEAGTHMLTQVSRSAAENAPGEPANKNPRSQERPTSARLGSSAPLAPDEKPSSIPRQPTLPGREPLRVDEALVMSTRLSQISRDRLVMREQGFDQAERIARGRLTALAARETFFSIMAGAEPVLAEAQEAGSNAAESEPPTAAVASAAQPQVDAPPAPVVAAAIAPSPMLVGERSTLSWLPILLALLLGAGAAGWLVRRQIRRAYRSELRRYLRARRRRAHRSINEPTSVFHTPSSGIIVNEDSSDTAAVSVLSGAGASTYTGGDATAPMPQLDTAAALVDPSPTADVPASTLLGNEDLTFDPPILQETADSEDGADLPTDLLQQALSGAQNTLEEDLIDTAMPVANEEPPSMELLNLDGDMQGDEAALDAIYLDEEAIDETGDITIGDVFDLSTDDGTAEEEIEVDAASLSALEKLVIREVRPPKNKHSPEGDAEDDISGTSLNTVDMPLDTALMEIIYAEAYTEEDNEDQKEEEQISDDDIDALFQQSVVQEDDDADTEGDGRKLPAADGRR